MRKICVYVDTSVFGGVEDEEFAAASRRFFERVRGGEFIVLISQTTMDELDDAPSRVKNVLTAISGEQLEFIPIGDEATSLAKAYVNANILGTSSFADALHVALATVAGADLILSWNFRHIVNYDRIHKYNGVNALQGYPAIDIHSPLEMYDDDENKNI